MAKLLPGGWELAGVTEFQVGQPLAITQANLNADTEFTEAQRPNGNGLPVFSGPQTLARWFNTANFSLAPEGTLGTSARFPLHGPGVENWDLALQRNFVIRERVKLQFRGQFFNAWNHANFVDRLWTADNATNWQDAIERGAAGIQTDHPAELVAYLRSRGLHK